MSLHQQLIEAQLAKLQRELAEARGELPPVHTPNEVLESEYLTQTPVNSGPAFLKVRASIWTEPRLSVDGVAIKNSEEARRIAERRGLKGIRILWPGEEDEMDCEES